MDKQKIDQKVVCVDVEDDEEDEADEKMAVIDYSFGIFYSIFVFVFQSCSFFQVSLREIKNSNLGRGK